MKRVVGFLYGVFSYLLFLAVMPYAVAWVGDLAVPWTIDSPETELPFGQALAVNVALLGIFAVQHSGMARQRFKEWWAQFVPERLERSTYVLVSSLLFVALFLLWQPLNTTVWEVSGPTVSVALWVLFGVGWLIVISSTFLIDHSHLVGLNQAAAYWNDDQVESKEFQTPGLYKYVRHPLMLGFLIAFWATPHMTLGHLVFSILVTGYIFIGISFEERALLDHFGETYEKYRKTTPMLIPWKGKTR